MWTAQIISLRTLWTPWFYGLKICHFPRYHRIHHFCCTIQLFCSSQASSIFFQSPFPAETCLHFSHRWRLIGLKCMLSLMFCCIEPGQRWIRKVELEFSFQGAKSKLDVKPGQLGCLESRSSIWGLRCWEDEPLKLTSSSLPWYVWDEERRFWAVTPRQCFNYSSPNSFAV